ncbi:MAG: NAD-dependent epimerase/dehydratase family protein, partial [Flavobacteriaceae bacterium]|nr:NAD-dependent epimerase/dehydratase family protein [Flavobacteriaceae bacterium]
MSEKILIIGACGQIGSELTMKLRSKYSNEQVIASDIREGNDELMQSGPFEFLDATDKAAILMIIHKHQITTIYLMAAMLSATAEKQPKKAWDINMNTLLSILDFAKEKIISKVYWPSSIAVFGETTPRIDTPQQTILEPATVYGISKLAGERWCAYYHQKFGVDVRTLRYPGIISWKTPPGGGTTDYAVDIFYKAIAQNKYECFLSAETTLPMMYMDDALKATLDIMDAPLFDTYVAYNVAAVSFNPRELAAEIQKIRPDF